MGGLLRSGQEFARHCAEVRFGCLPSATVLAGLAEIRADRWRERSFVFVNPHDEFPFPERILRCFLEIAGLMPRFRGPVAPSARSSVCIWLRSRKGRGRFEAFGGRARVRFQHDFDPAWTEVVCLQQILGSARVRFLDDCL